MDKTNERTILNFVYDENEYAEILPSEQPDFRIRHHFHDSFFGVEITEFYYSESMARLRKIPAYFNELISKNQYRHKVDKTSLRVEDLTILSPDGVVKEKTRGVMQELPQPKEYANMLASVIRSKGVRFTKYDKELDHINLIILEAQTRLPTITADQVYEYLYTTELKEALFASVFREIFFVTMLKNDRRVYIPLKMLLLLAEFHLLGKVIIDYPWETSESAPSDEADYGPEDNDLMRFFSTYLRSKTDSIYTRDNNGAIEVVLGGCGITLAEDHKAIIDLNDYPLPNDAEVVHANDATSFFSSDEFRNKEKEILAEAIFRTEIAFDVKGL